MNVPTTPSPPIRAFSYLRYSTPEQGRGDSFRRQVQKAEEYAARHGLELDQTLTFRDLGISAYHGRNAAVGKLGEFLEAVRTGDVPRGSFLLVESLDRISRAVVLDAQNIFTSILLSDITIVTLLDNKVFSRDSVNANPMDLIASILVFVRANEESDTKARRSRENWLKLRTNLSTRKMTARGPVWLRLDRSTNEFEPIPERVEIVQRVFRMTLEGVGQHKIAETFNREGIATFGGTKSKASHWHRTLIAKWLRNPAVIGTLVPHTMDTEEVTRDGKRVTRKVRRPQGAVPGYFPEIIKQADWELVQAALHRAEGSRAALMRHETGIASVLSGLARCPLCGSTMTRVVKGERSKPYLICVKAKAGAGCKYHAVKQEIVEQTILGMAPLLYQQAKPLDDALAARLAGIDGDIFGTEAMIDNLADELARSPSPVIRQKLSQLETQRRKLGAERDEAGAAVRFGGETILNRKLDDLARLNRASTPAETNVVLRQLFSAVIVDWQDEVLRFKWRHRPNPEDDATLSYGGFDPVPGGWVDPANERKRSPRKDR